MSQAGYVQIRGATADSGGLTIIAANPPELPIGRWIEDLHEKARAAIANDNLGVARAQPATTTSRSRSSSSTPG